MTAEVAILNKSAVALAADSAVSIGRPGNRKIYNTVNKIFELSAHRPIGIMIYGRLDFMGLPLETIIKQYRIFLGDKEFDFVRQYREDFCDYLSKHVKVTDDDERSNCVTVLFDALKAANDEIHEEVMREMIKRGKYMPSKVNTIAQAIS